MIKVKLLRYILFFALTLISSAILSQQDCSSAYRFRDSIGYFEIKNGFGNQLEISNNSIKSDKFFTKEHASAWVIIEFTRDCEFSFDFIPIIESEDYDFLVFEYFEGSTCDSILNRTKLPIRSNLSRRNPSLRSVTGLRKEANNYFTAAGVGSSFSKSVSILKGKSLLVVFDAPYGVKNAFNIANTSIFEEEYVAELTPLEEYVDMVKELGPKKVTFNVFDKNKKLIVKPKMILKALPKEHRRSLSFDSVGNVVSEYFKSYVTNRILITQPGYVQKEFNFKWTGTTDTIMECNLVALAEGMKLQFENILFQTNSTSILKGSEDELENLTVFLWNNDNLVVEIGGHIYSGKQRNRRKFIKLSKKRAKVVYHYLVAKGISKSNLRHRGYGNSRMLYRFPKSEREYRANRRVELTIISI